jgi:hypothetical protein
MKGIGKMAGCLWSGNSKGLITIVKANVSEAALTMSYRRGTYTPIGIAGAADLQADEAQLHESFETPCAGLYGDIMTMELRFSGRGHDGHRHLFR